MKAGWKKWIVFSKKVANIEATVLLFLLYFILIVPIGIFIQIFFKGALQGERSISSTSTFWKKKKKINQNISFAHEQ